MQSRRVLCEWMGELCQRKLGLVCMSTSRDWRDCVISREVPGWGEARRGEGELGWSEPSQESTMVQGWPFPLETMDID